MTVAMRIMVCQQTAEFERMVAVVVQPPCVDCFRDDLSLETLNSRVAVVLIVVNPGSKCIPDSLELVFATHLHLESLNFHCSKLP
ncbi:hypothetical protein HanIR_Chr02g0091431 [Helianthus annuus]|nr:hypothetical protein HanIR_Chr02g0091431 [Helianthus annuus]